MACVKQTVSFSGPLMKAHMNIYECMNISAEEPSLDRRANAYAVSATLYVILQLVASCVSLHIDAAQGSVCRSVTEIDIRKTNERMPHAMCICCPFVRALCIPPSIRCVISCSARGAACVARLNLVSRLHRLRNA